VSERLTTLSINANEKIRFQAAPRSPVSATHCSLVDVVLVLESTGKIENEQE